MAWRTKEKKTAPASASLLARLQGQGWSRHGPAGKGKARQCSARHGARQDLYCQAWQCHPSKMTRLPYQTAREPCHFTGGEKVLPSDMTAMAELEGWQCRSCHGRTALTATQGRQYERGEGLAPSTPRGASSVVHHLRFCNPGWRATSRGCLVLEVQQVNYPSREDGAGRIGQHHQQEAFQLHRQHLLPEDAPKALLARIQRDGNRKQSLSCHGRESRR